MHLTLSLIPALSRCQLGALFSYFCEQGTILYYLEAK